MKRTLITAAVAAASLVPAAIAFADNVQVDLGPGQQVVGWVCQNQNTVGILLTALLVHLGASGGSAVLKKLGLSDNTIGAALRIVALDLKTVQETQAAAVAAPQPPQGPKT